MKSSAAGRLEVPIPKTISHVPNEGRGNRLFVIAIMLLWVVVYIPGLFSPPLLDDADSVHAEAAREMVVRHDWVTLHANGIRYLEKAPLMYWGIAGMFKFFGVTEWTARLPLTLGTLATLLAVYALGRRTYGPRGGFLAAIILATGFGPYIYTRILIPDLLVGLWLTLGYLFFLRILEQDKPSRLDCWGLAVTMALNVLTKGLIGLVFPIGTIFLFLLLTRNLKVLLRMRVVSSLIVFIVVAAPWHILAGLANPTVNTPNGPVRGFFWFYFINEHFLRYLNKRVPVDYDTVPLALFWALTVLWLIPWTMFVIQALGQVPHKLRDYAAGLDRRQQANLLFAIWAFLIVLFFSFSTRQEYYTIPALPGLALLVGGWFVTESEAPADSRTRRWGRISSTALFVLGIAVFVSCMVLLQMSQSAPPGAELYELLKKNPGEYALSMGHVLDLTPQALGIFRVPLVLFGVAFLLGSGLNWFFRRHNLPNKGNMALAAMMIAVLFCVHAGLVIFSPILTSKKLAVAVAKVYRPGDVIVIDGEYEPGSTMNFYTGQQVHLLGNEQSNLWYGSKFPDAPKIFETDGSFAQLWNGKHRVFFWSDKENPSALNGKASYLFAHSGGKAVYSNQP